MTAAVKAHFPRPVLGQIAQKATEQIVQMIQHDIPKLADGEKQYYALHFSLEVNLRSNEFKLHFGDVPMILQGGQLVANATCRGCKKTFPVSEMVTVAAVAPVCHPCHKRINTGPFSFVQRAVPGGVGMRGKSGGV